MAACASAPPQATTPPTPTATATVRTGPATTTSGKARIAVLLPLSGRLAPLGQSLQQAAELALFDGASRELALSVYDSGESAEAALEAYRKARAEGASLVLGPLFGASAAALAGAVAQGGANVIAFSNDESVGQAGVWVMGIAAPPQVRRVIDHALQAGIKRFAAFAPNTPYGDQMARTLETHATARGAEVVAIELFDAEGLDLGTPARRLAATAKGSDRIAVLVPVPPPRLSAALTALATAGLDNRATQYIGTGVWDVQRVGSESLLRGAWYAAPDPARRADFERRFIATYGRPPHRLATIAYDAVSLAGQLARVRPGGDFSAQALSNPNGWAGIDGAFRFFPDGRVERALAVIEIQGDRSRVVGPAPSSFVRPVN